MLKERIAVAHDIVASLADAERTNDLALISTARLAATLLEARLRINAAAEIGQDAFAAVAATFASQADGRQRLVQAHQALNDAKIDVGLGAVAIGGSGNKKVPSAGLRMVETQAA